MEHDDDWPIRVTAAIGRRVAYFRSRTKDADGKKLTVQALANRCEAIGLPMGRVTIAKLESGLRQTVTPAEVMVLAAALEVPPVQLLLPIGQEPTAELLPGWQLETWEALGWFNGELNLLTPAREPGALTISLPTPGEGESDVELFRQHYADVASWYEFRSQALHPSASHDWDAAIARARRYQLQLERSLQRIRAEISRRGLLLPELPDDLVLDRSSSDGG